MKKLIVLSDKRAIDSLRKSFDVTAASISQSLRFRRNGDKNRRIRKAAMESGGVLLCEVKEWSNNDL